MGPGTIIQMGYREFVARRAALMPSLLLVIAVTVVEGLLFDFMEYNATVAPTILLLILSVQIYRRILGQDVKGAPYFPYFGNWLVIVAVCVMLAIPLLLAPTLIAIGAFRVSLDAGIISILIMAILMIPLVVLYVYLFTRLYYCLPGVAVRRKPYGFLEGWRDSAGIAIPLALSFIILALAFLVISFVSGAILGLVVGAIMIAAGPAGYVLFLVLNNLLAGVLFGLSSIFMIVLQGTVYREHTYRVNSDAVEVF